MKPAIVFVAAFVVAAAGGTGAKVMLAKPAPTAAADSAKSDSTAADSAKSGVSKHASESTPTDTAVVASGESPKAPADSAHRATPTTAGVAPVTAPEAAPASPSAVRAAAVPDTVERRIAKVFTSMDAKQAAKVLEHMSDGDVGIILGYVGVKQAAAIMGALPPERVATLSKLALRGGSK